jgi:pyruvate/2-oxoglutarate dehydrogenase complex dihydrolipoamide dehydrogenase (E3) component
MLEIGDQQLRFRRAVIATGGRPAGARVPGLESAGYLTNETIFSLTGLPESLLVLGGGPVGIELAQAFARFGSSVTVVTRHEHILPREDVDAARIVERAMEREGVRFLHRATPARADLQEQRRVLSIERDGRVEQVAAHQVLVAVGRMPNVEDLGLEAAGVRADRTGVVVDDRYRTSNRRIFAIGDVSSPYRFTHVADAQARIVVGNALFFGLGGGRASRLVLPWTIYTSPELARVGLTEREAREEGHEVQTITVPLHDVDRAVLETQEDGFFRVHLRKGSDRILGATLIAEHAGEMIGEIALAMTARVGLDRIGATIHPYPTQSEVFRKAADAWRRGKLTPGVKRGFARFFDMTR